MPLQNTKTKIQHLSTNTIGKDYIVGDIHGCLEDLLRALQLIGFNEKTDRLFSVGDLIDRGPHSKECAELVFKPWFYAVRGNHEQMMIDSCVHGCSSELWIMNGGNWYYDQDPAEMVSLARQLDFLPYVIVVGEGAERFNVVHAEFLKYDWNRRNYESITDFTISSGSFTPDQFEVMLWGRSIIGNDLPGAQDPVNMSLTFVGHTPVRETVRCQQQIYLDNGAVYHYKNKVPSEQNALVIACPSTKTIHTWNMMWKRVTTKSFDEIPKTR